MHALKWLPALLAVACLTGCGGKTNDSSQPATTTTITNSPGDSIVTKLSDVADDIGDAGKDVLTDIGDAAEDVKPPKPIPPYRIPRNRQSLQKQQPNNKTRTAAQRNPLRSGSCIKEG